ncbi:MAG TPA: diacylglycerol kinase family lipid kinase [Candidatus Anaerostipes avistercoris]|uniref:Diacylglycerol kinase family lipid kinase n=1 Tax=Candidatus Anaerostipes avistercoris TaxID=2838462 RepID=A0A9D2T9G7_9FIRM|nr:diacylglycerol kinase family protein [uncultured Anaerostipes sp.]HJC51417.1 diacylglycerol kinase family lipid kinase [Candidatus Anaerostipes avistercoris]
MKGLFIINPSSGKQNIESTLREIMANLVLNQISSHIDVFYTQKKDDAKNRAAQLKPGEYDYIVSVGGDGTLNEVTNGLIISGSNIPLAIISAGTVNDFATYMKLPQTAEEFCRMIEEFQTKKVDIGKVNNEYFINVLAAGMLTDIAYKVPKDKKAVLGKMAYYLEGVKEFPKQLTQNMTLSFHSKEFNDTLDIMLFLVTNSKSVGGFADAAPLASVSDGYLDVLILKKMDLLFEAPDLIIKWFQGDHPKHPAIEYFQTKELSVLSTEKTAEIAIDYDGEILEEGLPIDISIVPEALNLIILRAQ